ncbi:MAG TPA: ABC transporter permease, partial [Taishania sp.]|nr:ABC transporter permease [Taishania sp.]
MNRIIRFIVFDIIKNKIVLFYTILLFIISWSVLGIETNYTKSILSLLNVVLLVVPLVSVVFSTIYVYNSNQFIELLLSQPVPRSKIWLSMFLGLSSALSFAFIIGCGLPILIYSSIEIGFSLVISGVFLSIIFTAIAMLAAI